MISLEASPNFSPKYHVASCFIERGDGKILLLFRPPHKSEGNKWGVPAGKIESHEQPESAIMREVLEETGIHLPTTPRHFAKYYVRYPDYDFVYHVFHAVVAQDTPVYISDEHQAFAWLIPRQALELNLVTHRDDCINFYYFPAN